MTWGLSLLHLALASICVGFLYIEVPGKHPDTTAGRRNISSHACMLSHFNCVQLCATLWTVAHQSSHSMGFPGKNTGVGWHFLLQGIFPTLGSNPGSGKSPGGGHVSPLQYSCLEIPWTEKPGGLESMGSKRVGRE